MPETAQPQPAVRYEISRSNRDNRITVICRDGEFYSLPTPILHLGPWTGAGRGLIERLKPTYRALLAEQDFVLVYRHPYEFAPEASPGTR
ncbi:MAG TPA: hypothetical protein VGF29_00140 [Hyphomicrobiaceae bacterium]|jgi:hypothetical protein